MAPIKEKAATRIQARHRGIVLRQQIVPPALSPAQQEAQRRKAAVFKLTGAWPEAVAALASPVREGESVLDTSESAAELAAQGFAPGRTVRLGMGLSTEETGVVAALGRAALVARC